MASKEGCVTVNWELRNFSLFLRTKKNQYLKSPTWEFDETEVRVREGYLGVCHSDSQIIFFVTGFGARRDRTEVFFMSSNGDVPLNADPTRTEFDLPKSALFDNNRQSILLNDTMTLRCRKWGKTLKTSECHIATVFHSLNHTWEIEKLSSFNYHDRVISSQSYFEQEKAQLHVSLSNNRYFGYDDSMVTAELKTQAPDDLSVVDCALFVKRNCGSVSNFRRNSSNENKFVFNIITLRESTTTGVTLHLDFILARNGRYELSAASSQVARETPLEPNSPTNSTKHKNVSGALGYDFLLLYRESALSDATLNTKGKSFPAHRNVLAARSPVFRAMFEKDETSECRTGVVDIDDVDSETVDRMLVYLYGGLVGYLPWKEASALYYAADKYEILPLKEKCADYLKDCLAPKNVCDVLVLADRHSDQELMMCVVDFLLDYEEVVSSARWEELENYNPMLCAKIRKEIAKKKINLMSLI